LRETAEDRAKVDLAIAQAAEPARAIDPALIAAVDPAARRGAELGVLDMHHPHAIMVNIEKADIIHLLQVQMAGVIEDRRARVMIDRREEPLERDAVVEVLAGVKFIAQVDAVISAGIEDRPPAAGQFGKALLDQPGGALRPRIDRVPQQRTRECRHRREPEAAAGAGAEDHLLGGPALLLGGAGGAQGGGEEPGEQIAVGGVDRDQLALDVGGQFGDDEAVPGEQALDFVAIGIALGRAGEIYAAGIIGRHLHPGIA